MKRPFEGLGGTGMTCIRLFAAMAVLSASALASASTVEILPLSGMGEKDEAPVYWEFRLDQGRGSGEWTRIVVPSA